jgi:hypothetical protein
MVRPKCFWSPRVLITVVMRAMLRRIHNFVKIPNASFTVIGATSPCEFAERSGIGAGRETRRIAEVVLEVRLVDVAELCSERRQVGSGRGGVAAVIVDAI